MTLRRRYAFALAMLAAFNASVASAQAWPARPVRIIVAGPAGGPGDIPTRGVAQALQARFGQPCTRGW